MSEIKQLVQSRYKNGSGQPFELVPGQEDIFEIIATRKYPRTDCRTYTQYGKSETVAMGVLTRITTYPEKWCIVAPSTKKARIIMSAIISHTFDNEYTLAMFDVEEGESVERIRRERSKDRMNYRHADGRLGEVFILSSEGKRTTDLLDAMMGFGSPNVIIDESSLIDDLPYVGILRMLGGHKDNFLFEIGNAMRRNHFMKSSIDPHYHHINITCEQGMKEGRISKEFVDEMRVRPMFKQLYMNEWPDADAIDQDGYSPLFSEKFLNTRNNFDGDLFGEEKIGVDVAGEGSNFSTITLRARNAAELLYKEHTPDTMQLVAVVVQVLKEHPKAKAYIDKVGIGKPVFDRLKEIPEIADRVVGVMAGEKADNTEEFYNKRAEMYWRMHEWLQIAKLVGDEWIDLLDVKYKVQSDKKIKIKSKDEMRRDGIESPDVADGLSLTFYEEDNIVKKKTVTKKPAWKGYNRK
jgi:hypothetical protein